MRTWWLSAQTAAMFKSHGVPKNVDDEALRMAKESSCSCLVCDEVGIPIAVMPTNTPLVIGTPAIGGYRSWRLSDGAVKAFLAQRQIPGNVIDEAHRMALEGATGIWICDSAGLPLATVNIYGQVAFSWAFTMAVVPVRRPHRQGQAAPTGQIAVRLGGGPLALNHHTAATVPDLATALARVAPTGECRHCGIPLAECRYHGGGAR